jgi:hypothetical protein
MRERRSIDRGIEGRRIHAPQCDMLPSEMLARYLTRAVDRAERTTVEQHLHGCEECWAVLESTYRLFASH